MPITLKAECIFGHKWTMTPEQMKEAQSFGCAMCPTCGNAAVVTGVSAKTEKKVKK